MVRLPIPFGPLKSLEVVTSRKQRPLFYRNNHLCTICIYILDAIYLVPPASWDTCPFLLSRYMTLYCIGSMVPGTYIVPDTVSPHTGSGLRVSFLFMRVYRNVDVQIELCTGMLFGCDAVQFRS